MATAIFNLPIVYLTVIYARLLYFIRQQTPQLALTHQGRRAQRDLIVARRILFLVSALTLPVLPNVVYLTIVTLNPMKDGSYYMYRVQWMGPSISILLASVGLVIITPKIGEILPPICNGNRRRVAPGSTINNDQLPSIMQ